MGLVVRTMRRVPLVVWLFIATAQILIIPARCYHIPELDRTIESFDDGAADAKIKHTFEQLRSEKLWDLIVAIFLAPVALGLAYWKWSSRSGAPLVHGRGRASGPVGLSVTGSAPHDG